MDLISNKKYFIDQINSSKANKMTALYHYSGVGFKKAILNLGVFRKSDNKMVGVLQWGCSFQEKIRLDRYVKEPVAKNEYLELNRFSMADSEGKNSESQAISLGIKWIRVNMPQIRLLVSYAGRKEGNYGYIYQATNWEYLGYFLSDGFWYVDGEERHVMTLWSRYKKYGDQNLPFTKALCKMYQDVRMTTTKQFIYITRLDSSLTPASPVLPYPKPATEYPIKTDEIIYRRCDEIFKNYIPPKSEEVEYYYTKDEQLFSRRALARRAEKEGLTPEDAKIFEPKRNRSVAVYDAGGHLEQTFENVKSIQLEGYLEKGIREALASQKSYKNKYFRYFYLEPLEAIEVPFICIIDEISFNSFAEIGRYLNVSRQAIHSASKKQAKTICGKQVIWMNNLKE